jgi:hypothetical protein
MKTRCYNHNYPVNHRYKENGIIVCKRWLGANGFVNFAKDVGEPPTKFHTIERINNLGNYTPKNVRWATRAEQGVNKVNNRFLTAFGRTMALAQWGRTIGVSESCIRFRLRRGWSVEKALTP